MEADVIELSHVFTDVLVFIVYCKRMRHHLKLSQDLTKEQQPNIEQIDQFVAGARYKVEDARSELEKVGGTFSAVQTLVKLYFAG